MTASQKTCFAAAIMSSCFVLAGCQVFSSGSSPTLGRLSPFNRLPAQSEPEVRDAGALEPASFSEAGEETADVSSLSQDDPMPGDHSRIGPGHRPLPVTESRPAVTDDQARVPVELPAG